MLSSRITAAPLPSFASLQAVLYCGENRLNTSSRRGRYLPTPFSRSQYSTIGLEAELWSISHTPRLWGFTSPSELSPFQRLLIRALVEGFRIVRQSQNSVASMAPCIPQNQYIGSEGHAHDAEGAGDDPSSYLEFFPTQITGTQAELPMRVSSFSITSRISRADILGRVSPSSPSCSSGIRAAVIVLAGVAVA